MSKKKTVIYVVIALVLGIALGVGGSYVWNKANTKENDENMVQMANPVSGMSAEEAIRIALELGEGKNMGTWNTMSAEEFLRWWADSNKE